MTSKLTIWILTVLLLVSSVTAWGVLPARQFADFTYDEQDLSLTLRNTDGIEGYFAVRFGGDLAEYASYDGDLVYISATTGDYPIDFTLELPVGVAPGKQTLKVILEQQSSSDSGSIVSSLISLSSDVVVNVPISGNHVHANLNIQTVPSSQDTPITLSLLNKGEGDIIVWSDIRIYSPTNTLLSSWSTEKQLLPYLNSGKIETYWEDSKNAGVYLGEVTLYFADKTQSYSQVFTVGSQEIELLSITSDDFRLGGINLVELTVLNRWNEKIEDVYGEVFVLDETGQQVQTFKTSPEDIFPGTKENLVGYWDTKNLLVGSYELLIVLYHGDTATQQVKPVTVGVNTVDFTGAVIARDEDPKPYGLFLLLLIVIIVLNVLVLLYFKKSRSGGKK